MGLISSKISSRPEVVGTSRRPALTAASTRSRQRSLPISQSKLAVCNANKSGTARGSRILANEGRCSWGDRVLESAVVRAAAKRGPSTGSRASAQHRLSIHRGSKGRQRNAAVYPLGTPLSTRPEGEHRRDPRSGGGRAGGNSSPNRSPHSSRSSNPTLSPDAPGCPWWGTNLLRRGEPRGVHVRDDRARRRGHSSSATPWFVTEPTPNLPAPPPQPLPAPPPAALSRRRPAGHGSRARRAFLVNPGYGRRSRGRR